MITPGSCPFSYPPIVCRRRSATAYRDFASALRIPPAPSRSTDTTWRRFLRTQASTMLAVDFFHVDCAVTLKRIYVFFALEFGSRYVHILGATSQPTGAWTTQQARNLLMDLDDHAATLRFLVHDRAGQFTTSFRRCAGRHGHRHREDPAPMPESELHRRTIRTHGQNRTHPHPDLQRATPPECPCRIQRPLQPPAATSSATTPPATPRSSHPRP
jgi:putative transposase